VKILVIGSGAREHAIVRSLLADPITESVDCAPGNAGIAQEVPIHPIDVTNSAAITLLAQQLNVDLVVVGPEIPLAHGAADAVTAAGIACFGPLREAAKLEASKSFAKEVMKAANVPTSKSYTCSNVAEVEKAMAEYGAPFVIKDDGLAAGKGVVVTNEAGVAIAHAHECFATPDAKVVVEEFLDGPEVSLFLLCDGKNVVALQPAQDFKRVGNDDAGPNTGGMGAYSPLPWAPANLIDEVVTQIGQPVIDFMHERGTPFSGVLFVGLAITSKGPKVIEFNTRFGDPETQVVLSRLKTPLASVLYAAATGKLNQLPPLEWSTDAAVTVVIASEKYPQTPVVGDVINGLERADALPNMKVLHAGTALKDGEIVTAGGRVLSVTATGPDLKTARARAYEAVGQIGIRGAHFRTDIAQKAAN
jgi:phosphoribosylamine--glycine ligase